VVKTWDFSEANEVQERLNALRAAKEAQRAQRRQRGAQRRSPRFPPQHDADSDSEGDDQDASQDVYMDAKNGCQTHKHASNAEMAGPELMDDVGMAPRNRRLANPGSDLLVVRGSQYGSDERLGVHVSEEGCFGKAGARFGIRCTAAEVSHGRSPPAGRPLPPPLLRSVGGAREGSPACRMTSWDILRPRSVLDKEHREGREGVKAAG
jgi:hypothetical protein